MIKLSMNKKRPTTTKVESAHQASEINYHYGPLQADSFSASIIPDHPIFKTKIKLRINEPLSKEEIEDILDTEDILASKREIESSGEKPISWEKAEKKLGL